MQKIYNEQSLVLSNDSDNEILRYISDLNLNGVYMNIGKNVKYSTLFFSKNCNSKKVISIEAEMTLSEQLIDDINENELYYKNDVYCFETFPENITNQEICVIYIDLKYFKNEFLSVLETILKEKTPVVFMKNDINKQYSEIIDNSLESIGYFHSNVEFKDNLVKEYLPFDYSHKKYFSVEKYWENRYLNGRNSGSGSRSRLALYKASIINNFITENSIKTIIELGCGDGYQIALGKYEKYCGYDISSTVIKDCVNKYKNDKSKTFLVYNPDNYNIKEKYELSLSLDVIYHISNDFLYMKYINHLFGSSKSFVIIYANNTNLYDKGINERSEYIRFRKFMDDVKKLKPEWELINKIPNKYPFNYSIPNTTSFADFYIFKKKDSSIKKDYYQIENNFINNKIINKIDMLGEQSKTIHDSLNVIIDNNNSGNKYLINKIIDKQNQEISKVDHMNSNLEIISDNQNNELIVIDQIKSIINLIRVNQNKEITKNDQINSNLDLISVNQNDELMIIDQIKSIIDLIQDKQNKEITKIDHIKYNIDIISGKQNNEKYTSELIKNTLNEILKLQKELIVENNKIKIELNCASKLIEYNTEAVKKIYRKQFDDRKVINEIVDSLFKKKLKKKNKKIHSRKKNKIRVVKILLLLKYGVIKGIKHPLKFIKYSSLLIINIFLHPLKIKEIMNSMYLYVVTEKRDERVLGNKKAYELYLKQNKKDVKQENIQITDKKRLRKDVKLLKDLNVAAILDEFTTECFKYEVNLITFSPFNWKYKLENNEIDILFVESCWFGNSNTWKALIKKDRANNYFNELELLVKYCKENSIPTIFWCKEDPPHYKLFAPTAKIFDYVFTSDENMIKNYKKDYEIDAYSMSFFCQPKIHNPIEKLKRNSKAVFAGTYYNEKPDRCKDFNNIMKSFENASVDVDIYDRCFNRQTKAFEFPDKYKNKIIGYLKPEEMWKAYKGYKYQINMNSVKNSPTMFARRVYESLASGTPVISNYSEGVASIFKNIVICSDDSEEVKEKIIYYENNPNEYNKIVEKGINIVLSNHTLEERIFDIISRVYPEDSKRLRKYVTLFTYVENEEMARWAIKIFKNQTFSNKKVILLLEKFDGYEKYINNSNEKQYCVLLDFYISRNLSFKDIENESYYYSFLKFGKKYSPNYLQYEINKHKYIEYKKNKKKYEYFINSIITKDDLNKIELINFMKYIK